MNNNVEPEIREYFASLGRKSRGTPAAHERAKKAADARWNKEHAPEPEEQVREPEAEHICLSCLQ